MIKAVDSLVKRRFLLCEDTQGMATRRPAAGPAAGVPQPTANDSLTPPNPLPAFAPNLPPRHHHGKFDRYDGHGYAPARN